MRTRRAREPPSPAGQEVTPKRPGEGKARMAAQERGCLLPLSIFHLPVPPPLSAISATTKLGCCCCPTIPGPPRVHRAGRNLRRALVSEPHLFFLAPPRRTGLPADTRARRPTWSPRATLRPRSGPRPPWGGSRACGGAGAPLGRCRR
uniref:Uncharacterized protein n=1 Tax=Arundo donax TaxID=35708 RepID=A0A0A9HP52_ARUDO